MSSRRLKAVVISEDEILKMYFIRGQKLPDCILIREIQSLPEGAKIRSVRFCPERDIFVFIVEHESFPVVPMNQMIPFLDEPISLKTRVYRLANSPGQVDLASDR